MKKIFVSLLTMIIVVSALFAVGCKSNIKNGSKITEIKMVLDIYDASGSVKESTDIYMELYLNYAPESTAHIIKLVNEGYYNGTCVSNINANWMEIGQYSYNENDQFVAKEYNYDSVIGEFIKNGLGGNRLTTGKGAIVFKRDYSDNSIDTDQSMYDTAKATMAICFSSSASSTFNSDYYCILGMVKNDDANENASTDLGKKSSIDKLSSLTEYQQLTDDAENKVVTYYYEKTGAYYTQWTDEDNNSHVALGTEIDLDNQLTGADLDEYNKLFNDNKNYFLVVPSVKLVISSMTVC